MKDAALPIILFAAVCGLSIGLGVMARKLGESQKAHLATYDELIDVRTKHIELQEGYLEVAEYYLNCIGK